MPTFLQSHIRQLLDDSDSAPTADAKGAKLEELVCYLFTSIPSVEVVGKNILDGNRAHELDVAIWLPDSELKFLDAVTIVECKSTASPVSSADVGWFVRKLQDRGANYGILVALKGITGGRSGDASAHSEVLTALVRDRIKLLILSREDITALATTEDLVEILKDKLVHLTLKKSVEYA